MMRRRQALMGLGAAALSPVALGQPMPVYARGEGVAGTVQAAGSSIVAGLLSPVIERFRALQPGVEFDIGSAGSGTALAAMLESPAALGLLSRAMTAGERERLRARHGQAPLELRVALDALAIYVFKDNPVRALSMDELRRAFGRDADAATRWGALGLGGDWADVPVQRFGLEAGRGAHDLMRSLVLGNRDFAADLSVEPVSTSVVQGVATQRGGIGYASVFFRTQRTRILPILHQGRAVEPGPEEAAAGHYPLARSLYVIVNRPPGTPMPAAPRQFLRFLLSADGQDIVARQGQYPLSAGQVREALARLDGPP